MMLANAIIAALIAASSAAYAQQPRPASGPKICSQAATFVKQQ
jgi:hypothetical protein